MASLFFTADINDKTLFPTEKLRDLGNMHCTSSYQHICMQMCILYIIYVDYALE